MANMVDAACIAVMAFAARCLSVGIMLASRLRRAVVFSTLRASAARSASAHRLPLVWQQFFDSAVQLRRQPGEHVLEIGPRLVPIELGRLRRSPNYAECFWKDAFPVGFAARESGSIQIRSA